VDTILFVIIYLATPLERSGSKKGSYHRKSKRPLATLVSYPEKIIRSGKALQRQTSKSARASRPGISRRNSSFVSREPLVKYTSTETSSSQKIVIESEILKGDEPSISSNVIDLISDHITISDLGR